MAVSPPGFWPSGRTLNIRYFENKTLISRYKSIFVDQEQTTPYLSSIKKLAGQTMWYGVSSIFARFLNYLLTPYLTLMFTGTTEYGKMSLVYSLIPFLNVAVVFALDTAYFRYIQRPESGAHLYDTLIYSLFLNTLLITGLIILFRHPIASFIHIEDHAEYITFAAFIIGFEALSALPFARLRHENRPRHFAFIRVSAILLNIFFTFFFLSICPKLAKTHPNSVWLLFYSPGFGVGYVLLANLISSAFQFLALSGQFRKFNWSFDKKVWIDVMIYALPLTIAGFGGMINETFDRIMLAQRLPRAVSDYQVGVYAACYKLSLLITLFVQAFRMGAEPFFFRQAVEGDAPRTYARVMKFFVITICIMFLVVALYLDVWKQFIRDKTMWQGLGVVPILLFANMFLGIYYNLSIWYKLSRNTRAGAYITLIGAGITLIINYVFIPRFSYWASAWATFLCYGSMMVISFVWGQKAYHVPYAWKKLVAYMVIVAVLFFVHYGFTHIWHARTFSLVLATLLTGAYTLFILRVERKEFRRLPVIGKFL
jgi:O-antigen/teichoic acid export membrane protein